MELTRRELLAAMPLVAAGCGSSDSTRVLGDLSPAESNTQRIQAALAEVGEGGTVVIPPGEWPLCFDEAPGIFLEPRTQIVGHGRNSRLKIVAATTERTHVFWARNARECSVRDLVIDLNGHGSIGATDARINGVTLQESNSCLVSNIAVLNGHGYGVWVFGSEQCDVVGCHLRDLGDAIELSNGARFNRVRGNLIESSGVVSWISNGIICFADSTDNLLNDNLIRGSFGAGISTVSPWGDGDRNLIIGNLLELEHTVGVYLGGKENVASQNRIRTTFHESILETTATNLVGANFILEGPPDENPAEGNAAGEDPR